MQTEDSICLCCFQEETAPVWKPVVIPAPDFDECGQEFDPIVTDNYDLVGFEDYCPKCKSEFERQRQADEDASASYEIGPLF
jgi:hypothetical protein